MKIDGLHEKEIFENDFPFRFIVNKNIDFMYSAHWHSAIELLYIIENDFTVFVNSEKIHLNQGDILFIPGGDIHEFNDEPNTGTRIFINFDISSLDSYRFMDSVKRVCDSVHVITADECEIYDAIKDQIDKIILERETDNEISRLYYIARMIDILVLLCRTMPSSINAANLSEKKNIAGLEKINKSFEYIEKNYMEDIHLSDIAKSVGFSEYYFSRLFKEIIGKNFHQYLNEYRIKKVERLLDSKDYSISEAAYAVGFSSISTFGRLFKQIKGCTPQEYRKLRTKM